MKRITLYAFIFFSILGLVSPISADDPMPPGLDQAIRDPKVAMIVDATIVKYNKAGHGAIKVHTVYKPTPKGQKIKVTPLKWIRGYGYVGSEKIAPLRVVAGGRPGRFLFLLDGDLLYSTYNNRFPIKEGKDGLLEVGVGFNGGGAPWKPLRAMVKLIPGVASTLSPSAELPDSMDEYDLVNRENLEDLFAKPKVGKNFVEEKLSRDSYNAKQKGNLAKLLKEERKGLGVAFFRTNKKNYGKLLYTWEVGPKLHLKEVVVFRTKENLILESIVIGSAGHLDLDTGKGTHKPGVFDDKYNPDLHFSNVDGQLMFLIETDGARLLFPMKSIRSEGKPKNNQ